MTYAPRGTAQGAEEPRKLNARSGATGATFPEFHTDGCLRTKSQPCDWVCKCHNPFGHDDPHVLTHHVQCLLVREDFGRDQKVAFVSQAAHTSLPNAFKIELGGSGAGAARVLCDRRIIRWVLGGRCPPQHYLPSDLFVSPRMKTLMPENLSTRGFLSIKGSSRATST